MSKDQTRSQLLADSERLQALLQQLRARLGELDGRGFAAAKGTLPRPVLGKLRNSFGAKRSAGRLTCMALILMPARALQLMSCRYTRAGLCLRSGSEALA